MALYLLSIKEVIFTRRCLFVGLSVSNVIPRLDLFAWCVRLSRLHSRFSNALKISAFSFIH